MRHCGEGLGVHIGNSEETFGNFSFRSRCTLFCFRSLTVPATFPRNLSQSGLWPVMLLSLTPPSSRCLIFKSWAGILLRLLLLGRRPHDHRGPPCLRHLRRRFYGSVNIVQRFEERRGKEGFLKKVLIEIFFIPADTGSTQSGCYHGATTCHTQNQYWPSYGLQVQVSFFDENDLLPSSWLCNILLIICRWWRDP